MLRIPLPEYDGFALRTARRMLCRVFPKKPFPFKNWGKAPCAFMGCGGDVSPHISVYFPARYARAHFLLYSVVSQNTLAVLL